MANKVNKVHLVNVGGPTGQLLFCFCSNKSLASPYALHTIISMCLMDIQISFLSPAIHKRSPSLLQNDNKYMDYGTIDLYKVYLIAAMNLFCPSQNKLSFCHYIVYQIVLSILLFFSLLKTIQLML